jgi:hypothetical protein
LSTIKNRYIYKLFVSLLKYILHSSAIDGEAEKGINILSQIFLIN